MPPILQEILAAPRSGRGDVALVVADCTEELERRSQIVADLAHGRQVPTSIAVVGGTPHRGYVLVVEMVLVALVHQLVSPGN